MSFNSRVGNNHIHLSSIFRTPAKSGKRKQLPTPSPSDAPIISPPSNPHRRRRITNDNSNNDNNNNNNNNNNDDGSINDNKLMDESHPLYKIEYKIYNKGLIIPIFVTDHFHVNDPEKEEVHKPVNYAKNAKVVDRDYNKLLKVYSTLIFGVNRHCYFVRLWVR